MKVLYMNTIRIDAVAAGVMTNVAGSICVGVLLSLIVGVVGIAGFDIGLEQSAILPAQFIGLAGLAGRLFFTWLGGYVAARMVRTDGLESSFAVGLISVPLGVLLAFSVPGIPAAWSIISGVILTIPAARFGGEYAVARSSSDRNSFA
jgi:hypothetical protein